MKTFEFFKIDWAHSRSQNKILFLFAALAVFLSVYMDSPLWSLYYLGLGSVVLATTPFFIDSTSHSGFTNMLPATTFHKVSGRFLFSVVLSLIGLGFGEIAIFIYYIIKHSVPENLIANSILLLSAELIVNAIQFIMLYALGHIKSQQLMGIIRMVPGFLMLYGFSYLMGYYEKNPDVNLGWLQWIFDNYLVASILILGAAIIIFFLGIVISNWIVSKKDFI